MSSGGLQPPMLPHRPLLTLPTLLLLLLLLVLLFNVLLTAPQLVHSTRTDQGSATSPRWALTPGPEHQHQPCACCSVAAPLCHLLLLSCGLSSCTAVRSLNAWLLGLTAGAPVMPFPDAAWCLQECCG